MKDCSKCGLSKPLDDYWFNKRLQRRMAHCKACAASARKAWKDRNAEKVKALNREWQRVNSNRVRAAHERWKQRNPGIAAQRSAVWREANRERMLESQRQYGRKLKDAAYGAYGGYQCKCCGETTEAFLSLDHINNDGARHRREADRRQIYKWLRGNAYPTGFQVLCMNCNFGKARNGGICPHVEQRRSEGSTTIPKGSTPQAIGGGSAEPPALKQGRRDSLICMVTCSSPSNDGAVAA